MKIAFFDTKPYDKPYFTRLGEEKGLKFKFFDADIETEYHIEGGGTVITAAHNGAALLVDQEAAERQAAANALGIDREFVQKL